MLKKYLANLGERLYLKYAEPRHSLDVLYKKHIGERTEMTHTQFEKLTDIEKQSHYIECNALMRNPAFLRTMQWEIEEQSMDTMKSAANEFQFLIGKMSVYAATNIKNRFKLYSDRMSKSTNEEFDNLSPL